MASGGSSRLVHFEGQASVEHGPSCQVASAYLHGIFGPFLISMLSGVHRGTFGG